ncbi:choice-of-anchor H family protein [Alteromonas sp. C1M14]|uniref:choice-of-anchor H family protein n=1 Tax=Alteromonas sp. C1M14 TaxID=2841567 RepID=UPI001C0953E3|nr:choice-of-anchor H family protein [Alteromonas sp. C1M14]MBU2979519.1 choice-of-anchor H family protein [Alteromonas sp. C1M14]
MLNTPCKPAKTLVPAILVGMLAVPFTAVADDGIKLTDTKEYQFGEPYQSEQEPAPVASTPAIAAKTTPSSKARLGANSVTTPDFWIYDAWTQWQRDIDYDGYYRSLTVSFDADTVYAQASVYVVIYIGDAEAFYPIHTSSDFYIYGESSTDEFVIETDLISGFRPFDYDVMIELYDAQTGDLVAVADQTNDADLSYIPLESADYDDDSVVVVREHGGTFSGTMLSIMGIMGLWRLLGSRR